MKKNIWAVALFSTCAFVSGCDEADSDHKQMHAFPSARTAVSAQQTEKVHLNIDYEARAGSVDSDSLVPVRNAMNSMTSDFAHSPAGVMTFIALYVPWVLVGRLGYLLAEERRKILSDQVCSYMFNFGSL